MNFILKLVIILLVLYAFNSFVPIVEFAAGSPATLTQLVTSRPVVFPVASGIRPVRQRGVHFYTPSWTR